MLAIAGARIAETPFEMTLAGLKNWVWIIALSAFGVVPSIEAATVRLAWIASTSSNVAEYRVYVGTVSGQYTNAFNVGNVTSFVVPNLTAGTTYHFAVSAVNSSNLESSLSSPVSGQASADGLTLTGGVLSAGEYELRVQGPPSVTYIVDQSDDLRQWSAVATRQADANGRANYRTGIGAPKRFFRIRTQ